MNKFFLNIFLSMVYIYSNIAFTQNLVPNPSFEEIVSCPQMPDPGQIHFAQPWFDPSPLYYNPPLMSSSDLFNECAPSGESSVPLSWAGFQHARTGKGYAGIAFWQSSKSRERIEVELTEPLIKDSTYFVSMYVVNKRMSKYSTSTSNLGILLTKDSLIVPWDYYTTPSIENDYSNIISDTVNWTKVGGCYTAKGGEQFLTIGGFYSNENSNVLDTNAYAAYYLIDDVCVLMLDQNKSMCNDDEEIDEENIFPNVFTPNNDGVNDFWFIPFKNSTDYVIILNRWGNEIALLNQDNPKWDGTYNNNPCNDGTYFYKAFVNGKVKNGFIQLFR